MRKRRAKSVSSNSSSSKKSTLSTKSLLAEVDYLKSHRHRDSTRENYYKIWKLFNDFFLRLDIKPLEWSKRIILFVGYLIQQKKKSATIKSYLSAIHATLKTEGIKINDDQFLISTLTRACKLKNDEITNRLPITKSLLQKIINNINLIFKHSEYDRRLYNALFLMTYHGLFRIGEVTMSQYVIKAKDVLIGKNKKKLKFILHSSKTHTRGDKPRYLYQGHTGRTIHTVHILVYRHI